MNPQISALISSIASADIGVPLASALAALLAIATIFLWRRYGVESWAFPSGLLLMPFIYVAFALYGDSTSTAYLELLAAVPFVAIALLCFHMGWKTPSYLLAAGWALHGTYDLGHDLFFANHGTPVWYPVMCGVFDYVMAAYLILLNRQTPKAA